MGKVFSVPWAENGDKSAVPVADPGDGSVSYDTGWGPDYELDQTGPGNPKDVDRTIENQVKFDITEFLGLVQQNGLPTYDVTYDYVVDGYTLASDGILYLCLIANGPATTLRDPIGDTSGSWVSIRADLRDYVATFDFIVDDFARGSDGIFYRCTLANGPSSSVVDPVGDTTGRWVSFKTDLWDYVATFDYALRDYAKGSDGLLYRAAIVNGPSTSAVNPVGDLTGTWISVGGAAESLKTTILTANATFNSTAGVKAIKFTVTGGGGGGGGVPGFAAAAAAAGGSGGTTIKTVTAIDASYTIVVGAGGAGGALGNNNGVDGGLSSAFGASMAIITGSGGKRGFGAATTSGYNVEFGGGGGTATGGDINSSGNDAGSAVVNGNRVMSFSDSGGSFWGGSVFGLLQDGFDAAAPGAGGAGAAADSTVGVDLGGGFGADGVVVIEEYF